MEGGALEAEAGVGRGSDVRDTLFISREGAKPGCTLLLNTEMLLMNTATAAATGAKYGGESG